MGIFSKVSGADARFNKYKLSALNILNLVKAQAEALDRDFKSIMLEANGEKDFYKSIKLYAFIAGAVMELQENKGLMEVRGWKIITLSKALEEIMLENGHKEWDLHFFLTSGDKVLNTEAKAIYFFKHLSCWQGGRSVAIRIKQNDDINSRFNTTIFLDTLEAEDGHYADYVSNKSPKFQ